MGHELRCPGMWKTHQVEPDGLVRALLNKETSLNDLLIETRLVAVLSAIKSSLIDTEPSNAFTVW